MNNLRGETQKTEVEKSGSGIIYVSVDGEFTGHIPGPYSMISLGAAAYTPEGKEISSFKVNLKELPGASRHPINMKWWQEYPKAWEGANKDPVPPEEAMLSFKNWLSDLPGIPKLMGWPVVLDFMFIYWYYLKFIGSEPPFGHDALDIKTLAVARLGVDIANISRTLVRERLGIRITEFTHDPLDDAREQAKLFFALERLAGKI